MAKRWSKEKLRKLVIWTTSGVLLLLLLFVLLGGKLLPDPKLSEQELSSISDAIRSETEVYEIFILETNTKPGKLMFDHSRAASPNRSWMYAWQPKRALVAYTDGDNSLLGAAVFQYDRKEKNWTLLQNDWFPVVDGQPVTALVDFQETWERSVLLTSDITAVKARYSYFRAGFLLQTSGMGITSTDVEGVLTELDEGYFGGVNVFDRFGEMIWTSDTDTGEPYPYEQLQVEAIQTELKEAGIDIEPVLCNSRAYIGDTGEWDIISWTSGNDMGFSLLEVTFLEEGCSYTSLESHIFGDFLLQEMPLIHRPYQIMDGENDIKMYVVLNASDEVKQVAYQTGIEGMEEMVFQLSLPSPGLETFDRDVSYWFIGQDGSLLPVPVLDYTCIETISGENHTAYIYEIE